MNTIKPQGTLFYGLFDGFQTAVTKGTGEIRRILLARRARAATRGLLTHDDRLLSDIGVTRADVERALSVAWNEDPARALAEIRRRRLQAERQRLVDHRVR